jgi:hypothetical protein
LNLPYIEGNEKKIPVLEFLLPLAMNLLEMEMAAATTIFN